MEGAYIHGEVYGTTNMKKNRNRGRNTVIGGHPLLPLLTI